LGHQNLTSLVRVMVLAANALLFLVLAAGATSSVLQWEPAWGTDILVNQPPVITPTNYKNHVIVVNPLDPRMIVGSYDHFDGDGSAPAYATSTDGGHTWATGTFTGSWGSGGYTPIPGESNVAFDGRGNAYYTSLALSSTVSTALFMLTSTNGLDWNTPVPVVVQGQYEYVASVSLAVDQRTQGAYANSLHAFWTYIVNDEPFWRGIKTRRSTDGGISWSAQADVSDPVHIYSFGPSSAVASDGTVYVAFEYKPNNILLEPRELYLDRSTDGGVTWGPDRLIGGTPITFAGGPDWKYHELVLVVKESCNYLRINHFPQIVVSPSNPNEVYAVWNDGRWEPEYILCGGQGRFSDIAFSKTTDGGSTWSTPTRLNDDPQGNGIDQFQPAIGIAPDGTIGVTWYDRRYDPSGDWYDLVYAQSTDGGATWSPNERVTDVSSNPDHLQDFKLVDDLGVRRSVAFPPDNSYVLAAWLDTRAGTRQGDFYVDRGDIAQAQTPTPTLTSTPTPTTTPTLCPLQFEDVPEGSTFYPFVRCLACLGVLSGYPCGGAGEPCNPANDPYFRPGVNVTRGQIAKVVSNAAGFGEPVSGRTFEDVLPGSTFYTFTQRLATRGIMLGYPCGGSDEPCVPPLDLPYFRPNSHTTRAQLSKIVAISAGLGDPPGKQLFEDVPPGSTFYTFTQQLANLGVVSGYPCGSPEPCVPPLDLPYFRPNSPPTRGQVSKIVARTFFPTCDP
jgi:hypothetical protein